MRAIDEEYLQHPYYGRRRMTVAMRLFILGAKCLLAGTSVIAKEMIAETIKIETMNGVKA